MAQIVNFVFTLNNYTIEDELDLLCTGLPVTYIIYGYEKAPTTGTPHLQGYCELNHRMRIATIKKLGCGFEKMKILNRKGSQKQAIDYCKKDGDWIESGDPKKLRPGRRRDLDEVRIAASTEGMREVATWGSLQEIRVAEKYLTYCEPKRTWKPYVEWVWGPTGSGKSKYAHETMPDAYCKSDCSKWWEGYDAHKDVILDDFRGDWMKLAELLTILDRYERRIEFKGGSRQFLAKHIVITSCQPPELTYTSVGHERVDQLLRRIDKVTELKVTEGDVTL